MLHRFAWLVLILTTGTWFGGTARAVPSPFDLAGPVLEVKITRGTTTLPASEVPNLAPGDRLWLKADLPATQAARYLLVAAFLRGSTNPPPEEWFFPCKTWTGKCASDGLTITVPAGAQQVIVFLAPHTGGDLKTLVSAVRGRPGAFVRTSQDLNQAALDRSRLERYLSILRASNAADPAKLAQVAPLLARSLAIKVDDKCLDRLPELQAPCLMAGQEALILNDGHSTSIVEALTTGPGSDLAMEASYTPQLSYGYYSPYIASVLDIARIFDSFRTARYQYIPALASLHGDTLSLTLNTAPSFHDPQSVLVAALPAIEQAQLPPLHAVDPTQLYCARRNSLVLPVEGAPLVFSTHFAHDVTLNLTGADGRLLALPATADAAQGGYVIDTAGLQGVALGDTIQASLQGYWGFEAYQGPRFRLMNTHAKDWQLAGGDEAALIVGRQDTVHLRADSVSCVDGIMLRDPAGKELKAEWKPTQPGEVEVKLPLQDTAPGALTLLVTQYGAQDPQPVALRAFAEAGRYDSFTLHAGDTQGVLKGSRLDEVASVTVKKIVFLPGELFSHQGSDELTLLAQDGAAAAALKPEKSLTAQVLLKDGRTLALAASVAGARPKAALLGKRVQAAGGRDDSNMQLTDAGELPQGATLIFSLRALQPASFAADETIEVATEDGAYTATLSPANGAVMLENSRVAVATFTPAKSFADAAFGPLKFRVSLAGVDGDWQPLATLVRLPVLTELKCPVTAELACKLTGSQLFLMDSISGDADFVHAVAVPEGYLGNTLAVPHPVSGSLYVKLRDAPQIINVSTLAPQEIPLGDSATHGAPAAPATPGASAAPAAPGAPATSGAPSAPTAPVASAAPAASAIPAIPAAPGAPAASGAPGAP